MVDDPLNYELKKIRDVLTRCGIAVTLVKKRKYIYLLYIKKLLIIQHQYYL